MEPDVKAIVNEIKDGLQQSDLVADIIQWLSVINRLVVKGGDQSAKHLCLGYDDEKIFWLQRNMSDFHRKQIYELLHKKFTVDWIQNLGVENFKTFVKPIFLEGCLADSFIVLYQAASDGQRQDFRFQQCVSLLEEVVSRPRLACLLQAQSAVQASTHPSGELDAEQQILVGYLTSLPSKMANQLKRDNSEKFLPQFFIPTLSLSILDTLEVAHHVLSSGENVSLNFVSVLIGRLGSVGYANLLLETLLPHLCVRVRKDYMWCRISERMFSRLPPRCMETILTPLLRQLPWYGLVDKFLGDAVLHSTSMKVLLCTKLLLHKVFPNPKTFLQNIIGYISSFHTRRHLLLEVCLNLLRVWGDASSLRHISAEQHVYISRALMVCLGHLNNTEKAANESSLLGLLMPGVQTHLESSDPAVRTLGMVVAKTLTETVAPSGPKLEFELDLSDPDVVDLLSYKEVPPDPGVSDAEKAVLECKSTEVAQNLDSLTIDEKDPSKEKPVESDLDSDDDLVPYDMSNDKKITKAKQPKFVRDCMEGLICSSDDPDQTEICLSAAEMLIRKKTDGLEEISAEFAKILLHMQDSHSFEDFQANRFKSLVALTVACPVQVSEYLTKEFYERNYSIRQRMDILETLANAAQELSSVETKQKKSKQSQGADSGRGKDSAAVNTEPSHWREVIQRRIESNTRRFAHGRSQPEPVPTLNRFAPVAGAFFYPLMYRVDQSDPCLDLIGKDSLLLFRLLYTLAVILSSSKNIPTATQMGKALLEFTWPVRLHQDSSVRQAVLVATTTVFLVVPAHALLSDLHSDVTETRAWLEDVIEQDPDSECQKLAAQALCLLQDQIKKEVETSTSAR